MPENNPAPASEAPVVTVNVAGASDAATSGEVGDLGRKMDTILVGMIQLDTGVRKLNTYVIEGNGKPSLLARTARLEEGHRDIRDDVQQVLFESAHTTALVENLTTKMDERDRRYDERDRANADRDEVLQGQLSDLRLGQTRGRLSIVVGGLSAAAASPFLPSLLKNIWEALRPGLGL